MTKTSSLYNNFATDKELEKNGIILQVGTTTRDGKEVPVNFRLARAGGANVRFDKVFEHKTKPYKRMIQADTLDTELGKKIMRETYQETVILGWDNVQNEDGDFMEFNKQNVLETLENLPDLMTEIQQTASKQALFRRVVLDEDLKN